MLRDVGEGLCALPFSISLSAQNNVCSSREILRLKPQNDIDFNFTNRTAIEFAGAVRDRPRANKVRPYTVLQSNFFSKTQFIKQLNTKASL